MRKPLILVLLLALLTAGGCARPGGEAPALRPGEDKPVVAATLFPLADLTRQLGGEAIQVVTLLPAGASPHTFEPTPREMKAVSQAVLLISVGAGLDVWGRNLIEAAGTGVPEVVITEGVELLPLGDRHREEGFHPEEEGDPHVWLDPVLVRDRIAPRLAEALIEQWPELAEQVRGNLARLQRELDELDREYRETLAACPQRKFISFHATWGYLARCYGLEEVASVLEYPGQEPSARWLAELTDLARAEGVKVFMLEPQFNPQPGQLVAQEIGGKVFVMDPLGGEGIEGKDSYLQLMRHNLAVLKEALGS